MTNERRCKRKRKKTTKLYLNKHEPRKSSILHTYYNSIGENGIYIAHSSGFTRPTKNTYSIHPSHNRNIIAVVVYAFMILFRIVIVIVLDTYGVANGATGHVIAFGSWMVRHSAVRHLNSISAMTLPMT